MSITIYHNPRCSKSRQVLSLLRERSEPLEVVEYLKTPLDIAGLRALIVAFAEPVCALVRFGEPLAKELGLSTSSEEEHLLAMMAKHPILMNRPIVKTAKGVRLCRPVERLWEIL